MSQTKNQARAELKEALLVYNTTAKRDAKGHFMKKVTVQAPQPDGGVQVRNRQTRGFTPNYVEARVVGNIRLVV